MRVCLSHPLTVFVKVRACVCVVEEYGLKGTIGSDTNPKISRFKIEKKLKFNQTFFSLKARPEW